MNKMAETLNELHVLLKVTCEYCIHNATGVGRSCIYCDLDEEIYSANGYCHGWDERKNISET